MKLIRSTALAWLCLVLATSVVVAQVEDTYVKDRSQQVESKIIPVVKERFENLQTRTPSTGSRAFALGEMRLQSGQLIWRDRGGLETVLVNSEGLPEGHRLSGFAISPDSSKVAYYSTFFGQDLRHWNVVTIDRTPEVLLDQPALNRMQDFAWSKNSDGIYYSFWHSKEEARSGEKPLVDVRFRDFATQNDQVIFDHGLAENFAIADIDGGQTLMAYRLLNPAVGIKTTFSMYKGLRQDDGSYQWTAAYPRNRHVAVFLGVHDSKVILQTSELGTNYGVVAIDPLNGNQRDVVVPVRKKMVLHTAEVAGDKLILQYHTRRRQKVSLEVLDLNNPAAPPQVKTSMKDLGLTAFGNLSRFLFAPGGQTARAVFSDVKTGKHVIELDIEQGKVERLENLEALNFDASKIKQRFVKFRAEDGTLITGRLYTRKDKEPTFAFIRYYGWISIKNTPEPREVQMALELGGAYFSPHLPGGGERGAKWFLRGSRNRLQMIRYISESSTFLQEQLGLPAERIVAMGRSWGGLTSLVLAAKHGNNFGIINPVVPVIDVEDMLTNGWFGRIAHSDFAPRVDRQGNYKLNERFWEYARSISPVLLVPEMTGSAKINLFTNGLDDRVDQGGDQEVDFARAIENQVGTEKFQYHRSIQANHSARFYQVLIFSLVADEYDLSYEPLYLQEAQ